MIGPESVTDLVGEKATHVEVEPSLLHPHLHYDRRVSELDLRSDSVQLISSDPDIAI